MSDGAVVFKTEDGGRFMVMNGTMIWEAPGGGPQTGIQGAPAVALYSLCVFLIDLAWAASNACGAGNVAGAVGSAGWAATTGNYVAAEADLFFLADCVARGMDEPVYD